MSDGNWMTGCVVLSHCDLCSTSHCSLKTIWCQRRKPAGAETDGGRNGKENGERAEEGRSDGDEVTLKERKMEMRHYRNKGSKGVHPEH